MIVGIYPALLSVMGGGEKYIGKIAEVLSRENKVAFIVSSKPNLKELEKRLGIDLSRVTVSSLATAAPLFPPNRVGAKRLALFLSNKILSPAVVNAYRVAKRTRDYELFINQEHGTCIRSHARKSILICEVPPVVQPEGGSILRRVFFDAELKTYDGIVVNSRFTKKWAEKYYCREATVLYPPIDTERFVPSVKEGIVLSVGRFSTFVHCKKQFEMVQAFKKLCVEHNLRGWTYHLVGGLGSDPDDKRYLEWCLAEGKGYPIHFHVNAPFETLKELYGKARIFWHATGLGEDENQHPERMEHFGMTTVEAMSAGCVPIVLSGGGQPEIVEDGISGFLFKTLNELNQHTIKLMNDDALWEQMRSACMSRSHEFSVGKFEAKVQEIFKC